MAMMQRFDLTSISEITSATSYFTDRLLAQLYGLRKSIAEVDNWLNSIGNRMDENWFRIDVHCFEQIWGSTACGWGGMGGAAMTASYTVAIINKTYKIIAVFWDGRLAYCINATDQAIQVMKDGHLPGYNALSKLDLIYKTTTRNNY